jgi:hypothetical protein
MPSLLALMEWRCVCIAVLMLTVGQLFFCTEERSTALLLALMERRYV